MVEWAEQERADLQTCEDRHDSVTTCTHVLHSLHCMQDATVGCSVHFKWVTWTVTHLRPPQLHRHCQWGHSEEHAALRAHPTRYMCVHGVCVRGGSVQYMVRQQQLMVRVKGRMMQVYARTYTLCAYIMPTNEAYSTSPPTAPSAPPSGQTHSSTFTRQVVLLSIWSE